MRSDIDIAAPAIPEQVMRTNEYTLLGTIVAIAIALRLYSAIRFPFDQDELYSIIEATTLFRSPLEPGIEARPLYYLLQHPLLDLLPQSHLGLRVLPLVFGVLGVVATWMLAKRVFGLPAAVVAATLIAVSPWHLYASGMARYWSMVYLFAALFFLGHFWLRQGGGRPACILALVAFMLGGVSHPTFFFPIAGFALGLSLVRDDGRWGLRWPAREEILWLWGPAAVFLAVGVGTLILTGESDAARNHGGRGFLATVRLIPAMVDWMTPAIFGAAAASMGLLLWFSRRGPVEGRRWGIAAMLGVTSTLSLLFLASFVTSVYADYGIAMLPLVFVSIGGMVSWGVARMSHDRTIAAGVGLLVLLVAVLPSTVSHLSDGMRFDFRPAFEVIREEASALPVVSTPIAHQHWYAPDLDGRELLMDDDYMSSLLHAHSDLWVIAPNRRYGIIMDDRQELASWLDRNCLRVHSHQRSRFDYRIYRTDLYRCTVTAGPERG